MPAAAESSDPWSRGSEDDAPPPSRGCAYRQPARVQLSLKRQGPHVLLTSRLPTPAAAIIKHARRRTQLPHQCSAAPTRHAAPTDPSLEPGGGSAARRTRIGAPAADRLSPSSLELEFRLMILAWFHAVPRFEVVLSLSALFLLKFGGSSRSRRSFDSSACAMRWPVRGPVGACAAVRGVLAALVQGSLGSSSRALADGGASWDLVLGLLPAPPEEDQGGGTGGRHSAHHQGFAGRRCDTRTQRCDLQARGR
jgi:hypothetical protein